MEVTGVALEPHSETLGLSGIEKYWPEEELQRATPSLNGCPIHNEDRNKVIGKITEASYKKEIGVVYKADIKDEELGKKLKEGLVELVPRAFHDSINAPADEAAEVTGLEFESLFITEAAADGVPGALSVDGMLQPINNRGGKCCLDGSCDMCNQKS